MAVSGDVKIDQVSNALRGTVGTPVNVQYARPSVPGADQADLQARRHSRAGRSLRHARRRQDRIHPAPDLQ
jgi:hypothetical protein